MAAIETIDLLWFFSMAGVFFLLLPALRGFELAAQRDYSIAALAILLGQALLALALFSCALFAFTRRELILKS